MAMPEHTAANRHRIILPASPEHLSTIYDFLARETPADYAPLAMKIRTAVEELLMNVFLYAYAPEKQGNAEIGCHEAHLDGARYLRIELRDWGRPYDPFTEAPVPDLTASLEDRPIGGLGLHIVKTVTAHYCYSRWQDANEVELYFAPVIG